jgi:telomere length regulation protein
LIEQFFHNQYSAVQRYAALNALALGARELAGLAVPSPTTTSSERVAFPSKTLPAALHQRYIAADAASALLTKQVGLIADDISYLALQKGKARAEDALPGIVREKQLRIKKTRPAVVPLGLSSRTSLSMPSSASRMAYRDVAAEYFIAPLIENFWNYLRDEQTRETRTKALGRYGYRGAGTGMIVNPLILRHFVTCLTVMVHAARHSIAFLRVIAPAGLEVAVTLGSRPISGVSDLEEGVDPENGGSSKAEIENSVLAVCLELALVVLEGSFELDNGRELALEHTSLLSGAHDWTKEAFLRLDDRGGTGFSRSSADSLNRIRRAAAGVLLKIEEMMAHWRRMMVDI